MSLKGIELQIAIPKTFEAGKIAEQKQQQSQLNQDHANTLTDRQTLKNRETVLESEKYAEMDADRKKHEEQQSEERERREKEEEKKTVHPYKGSFVDFTG
ncbi:RNA polymerase subunit sigma [Sporosarcina limicola]|uniref:Septal ring factor EnvC (AmiA/AmiB activator) n=1 Tax=Sporosarcina limicola TaxID=34101 RepID=A0A927MI50_9BACL|nr:RNA polymerase subunit sigma [Sporosarcina limicola]MBE1553437.1 septal ring factor EnvC (AmiA/AmiB activator) [Sporosarcina limicola]